MDAVAAVMAVEATEMVVAAEAVAMAAVALTVMGAMTVAAAMVNLGTDQGRWSCLQRRCAGSLLRLELLRQRRLVLRRLRLEGVEGLQVVGQHARPRPDGVEPVLQAPLHVLWQRLRRAEWSPPGTQPPRSTVALLPRFAPPQCTAPRIGCAP